jgi:hypothetical protein
VPLAVNIFQPPGPQRALELFQDPSDDESDRLDVNVH